MNKKRKNEIRENLYTKKPLWAILINRNRRDKEKEAGGYYRDNEPSCPPGTCPSTWAMACLDSSEAEAKVTAVGSERSLQPL